MKKMSIFKFPVLYYFIIITIYTFFYFTSKKSFFYSSDILSVQKATTLRYLFSYFYEILNFSLLIFNVFSSLPSKLDAKTFARSSAWKIFWLRKEFLLI